MNQQIKPSQIVILASGAVAFLFSFFDFVSIDGFGGSASFNAWDSDSTFPIVTYIAIFGLLQAVHVGLTAFANVNLPERVISFTWAQIHLVLSIFSGLIALGSLILFSDLAIGAWFMLLGAIGLVVGSVMQFMEQGQPSAGAGPYPPGPGAPPPPPSSF